MEFMFIATQHPYTNRGVRRMRITIKNKITKRVHKIYDFSESDIGFRDYVYSRIEEMKQFKIIIE